MRECTVTTKVGNTAPAEVEAQVNTEGKEESDRN